MKIIRRPSFYFSNRTKVVDVILLILCCVTSSSTKKDKALRQAKRPEGRHGYQFIRSVDCYFKLHCTPTNWIDARELCRIEGSELAAPFTKKMKIVMQNLISHVNSKLPYIHTGFSSYHLGGYYMSVKGIRYYSSQHAWTSGEPKPSSRNTTKDAVAMNRRGQLYLVDFVQQLPFLCRKSKRRRQTNACGTEANGYIYRYSGHCYHYHYVPQTWEFAVATCFGEGGYLIVLNSDMEAAFIKTSVYEKNINNLIGTKSSGTPLLEKNLFWSGFHIEPKTDTWLTIFDHELGPTGYERWKEDHPKSEKCGAVDVDMKFVDLNCKQAAAFICESQPTAMPLRYKANP